MAKEFSKHFDKNQEKEIYQSWEQAGFFNPDNLPDQDKRKSSFVMMLPPPNITGSLHMGHALNATCQDILVRHKRMDGYLALWVPGMDHAGIATQNVVEKKLAKEGKNRHDLGREKFVKEIWEWKEEYGQIIPNQLKTLGASCDWTRQSFTMDENYQKAVSNAFLAYQKEGFIYQGERLINWCPRCQTALSDIELEHQEEDSFLWHIKYQAKSQKSKFKNNESGYIIVATTRPETMLGDTAVAVNPRDKRYKDLIGKTVVLPLVNREIPIVADEAVDMEFGTGAVKITPAHDPLDFEIGQRQKLDTIKVINEFGKIIAPKVYAGLKIDEAREKIVKDLDQLGLLVKKESHKHNVALCYRCNSKAESLISKQWFVKMKPLAEKAIEAVEKGEIQFAPVRFKKIFLDWMHNVKDWCISRQIWWGHQLPVFVKQEKVKSQNSKIKIKESFYYGDNPPKGYIQSTDVLDTWFSSALWPFAALGWTGDKNQDKKNKDLVNFYPTTSLFTAKDILYLWVARMIFSGYFFMDKKPFSKVYIHPTVLNKEGKRMSKSLGTGVDPMDLWEKYGADATRFGLALKSGLRQQVKFSEEDYVAGRNFVTKIWNATRFIDMNLNGKVKLLSVGEIKKLKLDKDQKETLSLLFATANNVKNNINTYRFDLAINELYEFFWHHFCDKTIEENKGKMKTGDIITLQFLTFVLTNSLKMLHPFMPFVTEAAFKELTIKIDGETQPLIISSWPKF
ncbi:MAG: valine--tRNA ligase [Patescibacteria group bacterium]|nr:valine--tRNA ligase [Patescibacteria group bacterium]